MNVTTTARIAAAAALGALAAVVPAAGAQAAAPSHGCPAGYESHTLDYWAAQGPYQVPRLMDEQLGSFGREPNRNGSVCSVKLGNHMAGEYQLYNFMDDSLPASS